MHTHNRTSLRKHFFRVYRFAFELPNPVYLQDGLHGKYHPNNVRPMLCPRDRIDDLVDINEFFHRMACGPKSSVLIDSRVSFNLRCDWRAIYSPEGNDFCNLSSSKVDVIPVPHKPLFRSDLGRLYQVAIDQLFGIVHELLLEQRARWARDFIAMLVDYILQHSCFNVSE